MGSSPVTATISPPLRPPDSLPSPLDRLTSELSAFLREELALEAGTTVVVAFSGGSDSTALLLGTRAAAERTGIQAVSVHVDHGIDPESGARAAHAADLAARIGVDHRSVAVEVSPERRRRHGLEAAARAARYEAFESVRLELSAPYVLTAHHRDDQAETVLMRIEMGTGIRGLGGMSAVRETIARPLLGWSRADLARIVRTAGHAPTEDPGNTDPDRPRNRIRRHLLPERPHWIEPTLRAADAARGARERIDERLKPLLRASRRGPSIPRDELSSLPPALREWSLALLHEARGRPHPPGGNAVAELERQLASGGRIGADCGDGWRWVDRDGAIVLRPPRRPARPFAYTLTVPGVVELEEIGHRIRVERRPIAGWMREGRPDRAALRLPFESKGVVEIRSRRRGDRVRPLGSAFERRLKEILIDRKVPRDERNRLPLLCVEGSIAWVPGVTIHDDYRLRPDDTHAWVASLERTS